MTSMLYSFQNASCIYGHHEHGGERLTYIPFFFPLLLLFKGLSHFFEQAMSYFLVFDRSEQPSNQPSVTKSPSPVMSLYFLHFLSLQFIICKQFGQGSGPSAAPAVLHTDTLQAQHSVHTHQNSSMLQFAINTDTDQAQLTFQNYNSRQENHINIIFIQGRRK